MTRPPQSRRGTRASRTGVDRRIRSEPRAPPSHVEGLLHPSRSTASACAKPGAVLLDEERRTRKSHVTSPRSRQTMSTLYRSFLLSQRSAQAARVGLRRRSLGNLDALVAAATRDPRCHAASHPAGPLGDNQDDSKGRKSMGNIIARATGIAFVEACFGPEQPSYPERRVPSRSLHLPGGRRRLPPRVLSLRGGQQAGEHGVH